MVSSNILIQPDFLAAEDCRAAMACFRRLAQANRLFRNPAGDPFWDYRYVWLSALPPEESATRAMMHRTRVRTIACIKGHYGESEPLYSDGLQLVCWPEGIAMPPHADNARRDGSPNETPHRDYASVIYLNEDFAGGELYFPRTGLQIKPRTGMLVAFTGGIEDCHGVNAASAGTRYTMPAWYTRTIAQRDRCELEWETVS